MADNGRVSRRMSLTTWTVVAVFIAGSAGAIWLGTHHRPGSERVVVTTRALPAFHTVAAGDVKVREIPRSAIPPGAMRSLAAVQGHYVLRPVGTGQAVAQQAIGPPVAAGRVVVPLPVDSDSSASIHKGALIDVLIAPRGQHGRALVMRRVLVVDEQKTTTGGHVVFLAVPRHRERTIALAAGRGLAILVEVPGHGT
jgi:Flp pilus assembly protein CpaB